MPYSLFDFHPRKDQTPRHVGLIPDGTRRWANRNALPLTEAYIEAMFRMVRFLEYFYSEGSSSVSVYLSSVQNHKRPREEMEAVYLAEAFLCKELLPNLASKYDTRVSVAGNVDLLPDYFQTAIHEIMRHTSLNAATRLFLCAAYSPLDEVIHAVKTAADLEQFINYLWVSEPLDLVVRTAGVNLLSNFLPLQAGYARIYPIDKLFNDTELSDLEEVLREFRSITRLFGD